jgi:hypothetical protein
MSPKPSKINHQSRVPYSKRKGSREYAQFNEEIISPGGDEKQISKLIGELFVCAPNMIEETLRVERSTSAELNSSKVTNFKQITQMFFDTQSSRAFPKAKVVINGLFTTSLLLKWADTNN